MPDLDPATLRHAAVQLDRLEQAIRLLLRRWRRCDCPACKSHAQLILDEVTSLSTEWRQQAIRLDHRIGHPPRVGDS